MKHRVRLAASWTTVSAPFAAVMNHGRNNSVTIGLAQRGVPVQMFVSTEPGCTLFEVTPVDPRRLANSAAKRTFASFDWL